MDAGHQLAERLERYRGMPDVVVLGVPRGGVVVAAEVARALGAELDVVVSRKIGYPGDPEFAVGAVAPDGRVHRNPTLRIPDSYLSREAGRQLSEVHRRMDAYRAGRPPIELRGKTVIVVDDGVATGLTALASVVYVRDAGAGKVVLAVPVISTEAAAVLRTHVDELVAIDIPEVFHAVGVFYAHFEQVSDSQVTSALGSTAS